MILDTYYKFILILTVYEGNKMVRRIFVGDFKIEADERNAVNAVLDQGRISEWKHVKEFEKASSEYIGTKYCIAVSSGTSALITGLLALVYDNRYPKAKKGAKVITSPITYVSTVNAAGLNQARSVIMVDEVLK